MMAKRYLIRLDDACPTMDKLKWNRMFKILDMYGIKPLIGIIPNNEDPDISSDSFDFEFWEKANSWTKKGWAIALHGYNHVCVTDKGIKGLNPMWKRSEFAGLPLEQQRQKIRKGIAIFEMHGINPKYFFAPSHTYDMNTLKALRMESEIRIISDSIATKPYKCGDFSFIPQLGGHCVEIPIPGTWTFCLHPTAMNEDQFKDLESFLIKHKDRFISFSDINLSNISTKSFLCKFLSFTYFMVRKIRGIR